MTREDALLKLLAVEPATRDQILVVTGWPTPDTAAVLDSLVEAGHVTYRHTGGQRLYYPGCSQRRAPAGAVHT